MTRLCDQISCDFLLTAIKEEKSKKKKYRKVKCELCLVLYPDPPSLSHLLPDWRLRITYCVVVMKSYDLRFNTALLSESYTMTKNYEDCIIRARQT